MNQPLAEGARESLVELRIPCKAEWVALARLSVAAVASRLHFSIEEIEDVKLAVAEACTTAIQHAHGSAYLEIKCEITDGGLRVNVRDSGHTPGPGVVRVRSREEVRVG